MGDLLKQYLQTEIRKAQEATRNRHPFTPQPNPLAPHTPTPLEVYKQIHGIKPEEPKPQKRRRAEKTPGRKGNSKTSRGGRNRN